MVIRHAPRTRFLSVAISDDDIDRVRATVSIVDVVGQHVQLRRTGRNWVGLCPFHGEKTPSFNVREETGRYKCFGCDASGDVFTFVQQTEHVDFIGSVEFLAAKAGIQLNYTSTGQSKDRARRKRLIRGRSHHALRVRRDGLDGARCSCWLLSRNHLWIGRV